MAARLTDSRNGYGRFALGSLADVDLPAVERLMRGAWQADYRDRVRMHFDQSFLRRLAVEGEWVGVLATGPAGEPVGFEMALARTLRIGERRLRAYYVTAFTVSQRHRRRGLGRWVLGGINDLVFAELGADCIFSTFHEGQAGSPTVQSTFDALDGFGVRRLHTSPIYSRRLREGPVLPALPRELRAYPVTLSPDGAHLVGVSQTAGMAERPRVADLERALEAGTSAGFALDRSFAGHYLRGGTDRGALWYEGGGRGGCLVTWWISPLIVNERELAPMGQIQSVLDLDPGRGLAPVLADLGRRFAERGCFAMSLLDTGLVGAGDLAALGFAPEADRITFAVRGPRGVIDCFETAGTPYFFDFV